MASFLIFLGAMSKESICVTLDFNRVNHNCMRWLFKNSRYTSYELVDLLFLKNPENVFLSCQWISVLHDGAPLPHAERCVSETLASSWRADVRGRSALGAAHQRHVPTQTVGERHTQHTHNH